MRGQDAPERIHRQEAALNPVRFCPEQGVVASKKLYATLIKSSLNI